MNCSVLSGKLCPLCKIALVSTFQGLKSKTDNGAVQSVHKIQVSAFQRSRLVRFYCTTRLVACLVWSSGSKLVDYQ